VRYINQHWDKVKDLAYQNEVNYIYNLMILSCDVIQCLDELLVTLRSPNMVTMVSGVCGYDKGYIVVVIIGWSSLEGANQNS